MQPTVERPSLSQRQAELERLNRKLGPEPKPPRHWWWILAITLGGVAIFALAECEKAHAQQLRIYNGAEIAYFAGEPSYPDALCAGTDGVLAPWGVYAISRHDAAIHCVSERIYESLPKAKPTHYQYPPPHWYRDQCKRDGLSLLMVDEQGRFWCGEGGRCKASPSTLQWKPEGRKTQTE